MESRGAGPQAGGPCFSSYPLTRRPFSTKVNSADSENATPQGIPSNPFGSSFIGTATAWMGRRQMKPMQHRIQRRMYEFSRFIRVLCRSCKKITMVLGLGRTQDHYKGSSIPCHPADDISGSS